MTNRKNQNSLLVLATLGVYLGLVLAGATPQVLAQAAMTKQFNVKDEVEVKEDLDKKPHSDKYSEDKISRQDRSDEFVRQYLTSVLYSLKNLSFTKTKGYDVKLSVDSNGVDEPLIEIFSCLSPDLLPRDFKIRFDENGYFQQLSLTKKSESGNASALFNAYVASLDSQTKTAKIAIEKFVLQNTEISFKNDQIMVVTRLPRAGLDSLLATDAK